MSLAGLDSPEVDKAYQTVQAEKAGWFLLTYSSRDSIEVHAQGVRGTQEMRDAALSYYNAPDARPLFGLIQFRRRKVLFKLVPESTTRLMKARVQVHWNSVTSRFVHDNTYEPTRCEQLDDNSLTQHIELHSSRSSPGSNKKSMLDGIEETQEERMSLEKAKEKAAAIKAEAEKMAESTPPLPELTKAPEVETKEEPDASLRNGSKESTETRLVSPKPENEGPITKSEYALSINAFPFLDDDSSISDDDLAPRMSTQISRPTTSERYPSSLYESLYKPKGKLGPRPSMETRPNTAKSARGIATLPAGMRTSRPTSTIQPRPKSRDSHLTAIQLPPPPPIPEIPTTLEIPRPRSSAGSVKSLPATLPKSSSMTPEKARLKRYQEMYKRKEKERARQSTLPDVPALPPMPKTLPAVAKPSPTPKSPEAPPKETAPPEDVPLSPVDHPKSDSGVGMDDSPTEKPKEAEASVEKIPKDPASGNAEPFVDHPTPDPSTTEQTPRRPSNEEPSSMHSLSSPTSLQESSGRTSTRPTSVSDDSLNEKTTPPTDSNEEEQVDTPSTIVQEKSTAAPTLPETVAAASSALGAETRSGSVGSIDLPIQAPLSPDFDTVEEEMKVETPKAASIDERDSVDYQKAKRRGIVPPLDLSTTTSEVDYDDDFMDELRDAEVVQAKTVSVSKSPITQFFPRTSFRKSASRKSTGSSEQTPPAINTKARPPSPPSPSPEISFARTPSGSRLSSLTLQQGESMVAAKPMKIQTGIASKIADLQRSFSRGSPAGTPPSNKTPDAVKSSISQRSFPFNHKASPSQFVDRPGSKASFSSVETASPITRPRAASNLSSRISLYNNLPQENPKKEIMEVRATIIRTDRTSKIQPLPPTADTPLELHESPLIVNHQRAQTAVVPDPPSFPKRQSSLPTPTYNGKPDSVPIPTSPLSPISDKADRESVTGSTRRSMEGAWRSLGRRMSRSEAKKTDSSQPASPTTGPLPRSMSNSSLETADSRSDSQSTKVGSRASRLMRRMSASMSSIASVGKLPLSPRLSGAGSHGAARADAPAAADYDPAPSIAEVCEPAPRPPAIDIGDLNVQFPDTLLWKRRWVEIDARGFVVLRPLEMGGVGAGAGTTAAAAAKSAMVKKYHLSEFSEPFMPDMERQEMPWSIVCDFKDGRCLQFGTASGAGQVGLLRLLGDSWKGWKDGQTE